MPTCQVARRAPQAHKVPKVLNYLYEGGKSETFIKQILSPQKVYILIAKLLFLISKLKLSSKVPKIYI